MRSTLVILFACISVLCFAQKDTDEYIADAVRQLDTSCAGGDIREYVVKNGIKGTYTFEITIKGKGQIASMNILSRGEDGSIPHQNALKDFVMFRYKLDMKLPKGRYYKFEYTFSFQ